MRLFRKRKDEDPVEQRRNTAIAMVHGLSKADKDRLLEAMELSWQADQKFGRVRTKDEKTVADIDKIERQMDIIKENEKK